MQDTLDRLRAVTRQNTSRDAKAEVVFAIGYLGVSNSMVSYEATRELKHHDLIMSIDNCKPNYILTARSALG